jgi:catechol 2,3-dioxygenase-like lactoylglutathione lyase family enzyme
MTLNAVIPNVFYEDVETGIAFFCDGLGFRNVHRSDDGDFCIVRRDATCFHLLKNIEVARQDRPEFRIATDDIDAYHREIVERAPHVLHPNGRRVTDKPWGLREFALLDPTHVCVIVEQPIEEKAP